MADAQRDEPQAAKRPTSVSRAPNVLIICADPVGEEMAGLGIRCWELARALRDRASVTVAHGGSAAGAREGVDRVPFRPHTPGPLRPLIARADAVVAHPQWPLVNRWLRRSSARVVVDLYCPETLETLVLQAGRSARVRRQLTATTIDRLHAALRTGHNFMCASETQRDLWLGAMLALRLIDPEIHDRDPTLRATIDLVPFGVPEQPPERPGPGARKGPRQMIDGLDADSEIVLWNGGIWDWLDAPTAIRAVAAVASRRPRVKLVFMGVSASHPAAARSTRAARELAQQLGLLDSIVFFADGWVPYAERGAWLTEADCAISTHADHLETRFAYRTRLLDCFWAGLPVVCTSGDELAEHVERDGLGAVAASGDVDGLAVGLECVLDRGRDAFGVALRGAAEARTWERVSEPLARWVCDPSIPPRPGDSAGAVREPLAQRLREAAYLAGGRLALSRR
jgi:glycosyltransferase involved in cell wall biosynthesis